LDNGALLIDTPGMRELGNMSADAGINETFSEIVALSKQCKFNNCTHVNEAGCAILEAIDKDLLSEKRYQNYLSLKKESSFNEMSYLEKKQKDKKLGQFIKSANKHDKRK
jgi:ribosome biogenesis GTPase